MGLFRFIIFFPPGAHVLDYLKFSALLLRFAFVRTSGEAGRNDHSKSPMTLASHIGDFPRPTFLAAWLL